jgi:glycerophosphoryl diester phosphodiesterase
MKLKKTFIFLIFFFLLYLFLFINNNESRNFLFLKNKDNKILNTNSYIAHSAGGIDGLVYTNSYEALLHSINSGFKLIELDLNVTSDNRIVALHDWISFKENCKNLEIKIDPTPLSYDDFNKCKFVVNGKVLTQLTEDLINIFFLEHKDLILFTDKIKDYDLLKKNLKFSDRIIPETFGIKSYLLAKINGFKDVIFPYKKKNFFTNFFFDFKILSLNSQEFIYKKNEVIKDFEKGVLIYVYTSNEEKFNLENIGTAISGVYTDFWNIKQSKCSVNEKSKCRVY